MFATTVAMMEKSHNCHLHVASGMAFRAFRRRLGGGRRKLIGEEAVMMRCMYVCMCVPYCTSSRTVITVSNSREEGGVDFQLWFQGNQA